MRGRGKPILLSRWAAQLLSGKDELLVLLMCEAKPGHPHGKTLLLRRYGEHSGAGETSLSNSSSHKDGSSESFLLM